MTRIATAIEHLDWQSIRLQLDQEGFAVLRGFAQLEAECPAELQALLTRLQTAFYPALAQISNHWNEILQLPYRYPPRLCEFQAECRAVAQHRVLSPLTCLCMDEYLEIRQDADGDCVFPLQLVAVLSSPGQDFTGGEFVLIEQRPRMQSRSMVVPLQRGDIAIITTAHRPFKGSKGYYRVTMKQAISRVNSGQRLGFTLSFHLAPGSAHDE